MAENLYEKLTKEQLFILKCARTFNEDADHSAIPSLILSNLNWDYILSFSQQQGIAPLLYKYINSCGAKSLVPEPIYEKLRNIYFHTFSKNTRLFDSMGKLLQQFELENIDSILLKGCVLAELIYRDIGLRPMDDVDILVKENQIGTVQTLMTENGYHSVEVMKSEFINKYTPKHHLPQFIKDNNIFEIHWHLHIENDQYKIIIEDLWKRALPFQIGEFNVQILRFEDMLMHLCVHLDGHFSFSRARFANFCDIAEILKMDRLNWDFIKSQSMIYKIEPIVYKYVLLIGKYFNIKIPDEIVNTNTNILELEKRFLALLQNKNYNRKNFNANVTGLSEVKGLGNKVRYISGDLFPTKEFMILRFNLKYKKLVYFYYPVRFIVGISHLLKYFFTKKK